MTHKPKSSGIGSWPEDERLRERLLARGADGLTDAELLAVLLHTGLEVVSVVEFLRMEIFS